MTPASPTDVLATLPRASTRRLAVRITKDGLRHVRHGHPWVWELSVTSISHDADSGDLAVVFDDDRRFVAIGLYDPSSPIRLRILHHGAPRTIDAAFWGERIDAALLLRAGLAASTDTNGYRLIHGENDRLPGLVVDRYANVLVIKLDSEAWFAHLADFVPELLARVPADAVVLRMSRTVEPPSGLDDGDTIVGERITAPVTFRENGLTFEADVTGGQKTGHFLDQRDNRQRLRLLSDGAAVLDVFSCTGGFSVHAAAGGARFVHSIDLSPQAIKIAQRNMLRNDGPERQHGFEHRVTVGDAFAAMADCGEAGEQYDIVIVDPPSFARRERDVDQALRAYGRLTALAVPLIRRGGLLVQSSCSSRVILEDFESVVLDTLSSSGRRVASTERTSHGVDHPIGFAQGEYLKTLFVRVQ